MGNHKAFVPGPNNQRGNDRQGQRQRDLNRGPAARTESTSTVPPSFSMFVRTTSMPTPRPLTSVIFLRRGEAGVENQPHGFAIAHPTRLFGGDDALFHRLFLQFAGSMPPPSSAMSMRTLPAWW